MRYMFLIYSKEEAAAPTEVVQEVARRHEAVMDEAHKRGVFRGAEPLKPTTMATTVRMKSDMACITDGPCAETKEQLAGYYILDCQDLDEAIQWAKRIPTACKGGEGCVEIRPIIEFPAHH